MNHNVRTIVFRCLDLLPDNVGRKMHHQLQNLLENKVLYVRIKRTENTFDEFVKICEAIKIDLNQKSIIEIGSGWLPIFPYFLLYLGKVKNVFSFDLNEHYQKKRIANFNSIFSKNYNTTIDALFNSKYNLPDGVHYYPGENIINSKIPDADIVVSRFVLEHVAPNDIFEMHQKLRNSLKKGTHIVHFISPSDHRAHGDITLSLQDFLKYSKPEWDAIQTKFDYHNRLRLPQYLDIFKSLGLEVVYLTFDTVKEGTAQYDLFKKVNIHSDYNSFSTEELTAGSINIVLKI
ncbi:hypothetical protein [Flavobacterium sp.]|uniref:hypothetical protein n=1 Tax=Flavobacterium sp. TaxID=239 RepID=UPI00286BD857|nr:hypothetical protein [Flavobacterium sp.]